MADYKEYKCGGCGYTIMTSPKGHDRVMMGEVYTYLCPDCKEIANEICLHGEKPNIIICKKCGSKRLRKWNPIKGKCPKCGGKMLDTGGWICVD